jgi:hypothetical protein
MEVGDLKDTRQLEDSKAARGVRRSSRAQKQAGEAVSHLRELFRGGRRPLAAELDEPSA